jgi:very-short-patch-repair endonuclease
MGRCPEKAIKRKTTEDFILESKEIWKDKYDYSLTEYTGALNNIKIIYNGVVYEQRASSHLLGLAPEFRSNEESLLRDKVNKSDKEGVNNIKDFLEKYQIEYQIDKNLNNNIFQFYLPSKRTVIEYLSKEHYLIKDLDKKKEDYCEDNYIDLIRINYSQFDDIYKILWENLSDYIKTKKTS